MKKKHHKSANINQMVKIGKIYLFTITILGNNKKQPKLANILTTWSKTKLIVF